MNKVVSSRQSVSNDLEVKWSIKDAFFAVLFWLVLLFLVKPLNSFLISFWIHAKELPIFHNKCISAFSILFLEILPPLVLAIAILGFIYYIVFKKYGGSIRDLGFSKKQLFFNISLGLLVGAVYVVLQIYAHYATKGSVSFELPQWIRIFTRIFIYSFLLTICQQVLFVGFVYPALKKKVGVILAVLLTSSMFNLSYFLSPIFPKAFFHYFICSIIFILLYEKRKSIIPSITAHFVGNLVNSFLSF